MVNVRPISSYVHLTGSKDALGGKRNSFTNQVQIRMNELVEAQHVKLHIDFDNLAEKTASLFVAFNESVEEIKISNAIRLYAPETLHGSLLRSVTISFSSNQIQKFSCQVFKLG